MPSAPAGCAGLVALAVRRSEFDVDIHDADGECLPLVATGLVWIGAKYLLAPAQPSRAQPG